MDEITDFWGYNIKISVIIPFYCPDENTEKFFQRCKESIDPRFRLICREDKKHEGVSAMRNKGLDYLYKNDPPDYITFLDADDTMNPDAWEQMTKAIAEEPDEPVIQMNHLRKKDGTVYSRFHNHRGTYYPDRIPQFWFVVWNKVFKADFIRDIRFIEGLQHGEDELFILECLAKSGRIYCSEKIAMTHHFDNEQSLSRNVSANDLIGEQQALIGFLQEHQEDRRVCEAVRLRQLELWNNNTYKTVF